MKSSRKNYTLTINFRGFFAAKQENWRVLDFLDAFSAKTGPKTSRSFYWKLVLVGKIYLSHQFHLGMNHLNFWHPCSKGYAVITDISDRSTQSNTHFLHDYGRDYRPMTLVYKRPFEHCYGKPTASEREHLGSPWLVLKESAPKVAPKNLLW